MSKKSLLCNRKVTKSATGIINVVFSSVEENVSKKSLFYNRKVSKSVIAVVTVVFFEYRTKYVYEKSVLQ